MFLVQWDARKAEMNFEKHGVSFAEAATVLSDTLALEYFDFLHSQSEDRFYRIGQSYAGDVLTIVYTFRRSLNVKKEYCRLISARTASQSEKRLYEKNRARRGY